MNLKIEIVWRTRIETFICAVDCELLLFWSFIPFLCHGVDRKNSACNVEWNMVSFFTVWYRRLEKHRLVLLNEIIKRHAPDYLYLTTVTYSIMSGKCPYYSLLQASLDDSLFPVLNVVSYVNSVYQDNWSWKNTNWRSSFAIGSWL